MSLTLIKGTYRIVGTEPDGDSVKFYPADTEAFRKAGLAAQQNAHGGVQLRLDAIDALETHYTPRLGGSMHWHQPLELAHRAGDELLRLLGFADVQRDGERVTSAMPPQTDGYILTRFADKYGRPVSLAYAGDSEHADLSEVHVDVPLLRGSVNHALVASGLAYPTFYSKLYYDLRGALSEAAMNARDAHSGVWQDDATTAGVKVSVDGLMEHDVILPKLFRRLADYLALNDGDTAMAGFHAFLEQQDDRLLVLSEGRLTGLDNVVDVADGTVRLLYAPTDLVFIEK